MWNPLSFFNKKSVDTRKDFFKSIYKFYEKQADTKVPLELLKDLCKRIADYFFDQYARFRVQYPKSAKRYSTFKITDLNNPYVSEMIIGFFKEKQGAGYATYAAIVLGLTLEELQKFEKSRIEFWGMF